MNVYTEENNGQHYQILVTPKFLSSILQISVFFILKCETLVKHNLFSNVYLVFPQVIEFLLVRTNIWVKITNNGANFEINQKLASKL